MRQAINRIPLSLYVFEKCEKDCFLKNCDLVMNGLIFSIARIYWSKIMCITLKVLTKFRQKLQTKLLVCVMLNLIDVTKY